MSAQINYEAPEMPLELLKPAEIMEVIRRSESLSELKRWVGPGKEAEAEYERNSSGAVRLLRDLHFRFGLEFEEWPEEDIADLTCHLLACEEYERIYVTTGIGRADVNHEEDG